MRHTAPGHMPTRASPKYVPVFRDTSYNAVYNNMVRINTFSQIKF